MPVCHTFNKQLDTLKYSFIYGIGNRSINIQFRGF